MQDHLSNPHVQNQTKDKLHAKISLIVNGVEYTKSVPAATTLLEFIREELNLTGTKRGCDLGECGLCTVLVNGRTILSCLSLAADFEGQQITTIEGISDGPKLHPVQEAFVEKGAIQCGYCTPAMVLNGVQLLQNNKKPSKEEVKACVAGTMCRCTGYTKIEEALHHAAQKMQSL